MDHTNQEREAIRRRREDEATATEEDEASNTAHQVPIRSIGTSATTSRTYQRELPRATTTATYVYQALS